MARSNNRKGRGGGSFVMLPHYLLKSSAWRDLDTNARALYVELLLRFNGANNGSIGLGTREAADALHVGRNTAARAFDALQSHGFIAIAQDASFDQKRLARAWLLTDFHDDRNSQAARKDFMRWQPEKQNIVPPQSRIGSQVGLCGNPIPQKSLHRLSGGTVIAQSEIP